MRPLFVASAPRCGSTFLRTALDRHPEIALTDQAGWLEWLVRISQLTQIPAAYTWDDGEGNKIVGVLSDAYRPQVHQAFRDNLGDFVAALARRLGVGAEMRWFGDKVHSLQSLRFAAEELPETRFVFLVRDPRDTLVSLYRFEQKTTASWAGAALETRCRFLCDFARDSRAVLATRPHTIVRYEELVTDPLPEIARVLADLELELDAAVEQWLQGPAQELFRFQGTSGTPQQSVGRWQTDLDPAIREQALTMLQPAVELLGYA